MFLEILWSLYENSVSYYTFHAILCILTLPFGNYGKIIRSRSFENIFKSQLYVKYSQCADKYKILNFAPLQTELDQPKEKPLTILEIGIGPGSNFQFYPKSRPCHLHAVDPCQNFETQVRQNLKPYKNIQLDKFHVISAEEMSTVQDSSVDVVITTEVLCSIPNEGKVLKEIQRVLKPKGQYYFLEHVLSDPGSLNRKIQDFLLYTGFWPLAGEGCKFFTNPQLLRESGFSNVRVTKVDFEFPKYSFALQLASAHQYGVATK